MTGARALSGHPARSALAVPGAAQGTVPAVERIDTYPTQRIGEYSVRPGRLLPFGATTVPGGVNFSVYSNHATAVTLVLFRRGQREPVAELPFPPSFRTGGVYAMTVFGVDPEMTEYGYRVAGPDGGNHRFDPATVLLDPYAKLVSGRDVWGASASPPAPLPLRHRVRRLRLGERPAARHRRPRT